MSRDYGRIQTSFWNSPSIQGLSRDARSLASYLLTSPHSNAAGAYLLPDAYIMADLGFSAEEVTQTLSELFRKGFAERFKDGRHIVICKFLDWNPVENPNVGKAILKQIDQLPDDPALRYVFKGLERYAKHFPKGLETVSRRFENPSETVTQTVSNTEPNRTEPNRAIVLPSGERPSAASPIAGGVGQPPPPDQAPSPANPRRAKPPADDERTKLYAEGKALLGPSAGGMITNLLEVCEGSIRKASLLLGDAAKQQEPKAWLAKAMLNRAKPGVDVWGMQGSM